MRKRTSNRIRRIIKPERDCRFAQNLKEVNDLTLIDLYFKTLDWCMERNFPTDDHLKKMKAPNFYYNTEVNLLNPKRVAIFQSKGSVEIDGFGVTQVFVRDSDIEIITKDYALCYVYSINSKVDVISKGKSKVNFLLNKS